MSESLNERQQAILEKILQGNNAFITGFAGSGKSYLTRHLHTQLKLKYGAGSVALTAMTGCAALLIGGSTLHSNLGLGLAKGDPKDLVKRVRRIEGMPNYLKNLRALIIDEVSMLSDILFDKVCEFFKILHETDRPFGRLQVVLVGDMSQLKPVEGDYCFYADNWDCSRFEVCVLTENMRVQSDKRFNDLLQNFRWGIISDRELIDDMCENHFDGDIIATKLFSKNRDSDTINQYQLGNLIKAGAESYKFKVLYTTNPIKLIASTKYAKDNKIQEFLTLCVGAQVMVTRNLEPPIVNGTRGVVVALNPNSVSIKISSGETVVIGYFHVKPDPFSVDRSTEHLDLKYIPLMLAWAISIHKSQGATIDCLEVDLGESVFAYGQAYTALSRARDSKSVKILRFNPRSVKTSKSVISFYNKYL